jgi:DNA-binding NarL/FixJ family response regulator
MAAKRALSPRESQVLTLLALGRTRKEIAYELELSYATVRVYVHRAGRKASDDQRAVASCG